MGNPDFPFVELFTNLQSWIWGQCEPDKVRESWMKDSECMECVDCNAQFTMLNRRHHCRRCGNIFCGKCTTFIHHQPSTIAGSTSSCHQSAGNNKENTNRVRLCNKCIKEEQLMAKQNETHTSSTCLSTIISSERNSSCYGLDSLFCSFHNLPDEHSTNSSHGSEESSPREPLKDLFYNNQDFLRSESGRTANEESDKEYGGIYPEKAMELPYPEQLQTYNSFQSQNYSDVYYRCSNLAASPAHNDDKSPQDVCSTAEDKMDDESDANNSHEYHATSTLYEIKNTPDIYDLQNNISLWSPPDPDDGEEEEVEEEEEGLELSEIPDSLTGSWRSLIPCGSFKSFGSNDSVGDQTELLQHAADDHFRLLLEQLLQIEDVSIEQGEGQRSWVDIVQSLAWEVAEFVRPDQTSTGSTMDPVGFVKIKCIASGDQNESMVIKGIVCKKNMAHRRMVTRLERPHIMILGGALEYQRVNNALSSIDTLLQQEKEHLKMAVAKIEAHRPSLLLVEKSVSRTAQDMLLYKNIPLVLNIKRPLLERIALCTNAIIAPSVDLLVPGQLGTCDLFHVDKFIETHECPDQTIKVPTKNMMFFEGCPRPEACTVILKGASLEVLKKVKHVMQVGIFVAYHASLEKSFLEDDRTCLPEAIMKSPLTVPLPNIPLSNNTSISTVPGFRSPNYDFYDEPSLSPLNEAFAFLSSNIDWIEDDFQGEFNPCKSEVTRKENLLLDDNRSILISLSTRCVWKRRICGSFQVYRIKYYGNFDKPLEQYLRENLFDQDRLCYFCDLPPEAHAHCYINQKGTITISMRRIPDFILPGDREKKIWTWLRCLKCPPENGLPPSNKRVILSSDTMSLSFGRFLELSFSDHSATTRVAECGHSVHKDCLRFYGTGNLVACFQYQAIAINSAFLPPIKLEFGYQHFDWVENEAMELAYKGELLFEEISTSIYQILDNRIHIEGLMETLKQEKVEFQAAMDNVLKRKVHFDILEINKLKRQLLFLSLLWDKEIESKRLLSEKKTEEVEKQISFTTRSESTRERDGKSMLLTSISLSEDYVPEESSLISRRSMSDGHFPISIDEMLEARWAGNNEPGCTSDILQLNKESTNANGLVITSCKLNHLYAYVPVHITSIWKWTGGSVGLFLPVGSNDRVIPVFENEPTSVISYALASQDYHKKLLKSSHQEPSSRIDIPLPQTPGNIPPETSRRTHLVVSFADEGPEGKVLYSVVSYYAKYFDRLRKKSSISEQDFISSLSRCKNWKAHGGKSKVFFAKSLDERFVIKQVTRIELESFLQFGPAYFKYVSDSIGSNSPTCLAKIYGIYQVYCKHEKSTKEQKMDVLVMENLLFGRHITRLYDLKGSTRSRYNPDTSGKNNVLLDENLIESMPTSPIFVAKKSKRVLERAVWNDTYFLSTIDVMDYSLLVGIDERKQELVVGIIDIMRQYTWDKHLETWVKASGILGGPKNVSPTVISPKEYKSRFRKAMSSYFLVIPDDWVPFTTEQESDTSQGSPRSVSDDFVI